MKPISKIVGGMVIGLTSLTGCEQTISKLTLNSYMTNRPVKEYQAIKASWREGIVYHADRQRSLDSVAFSRLNVQNKIIDEVNKALAKTKLKNHNTYAEAFKEADKKMFDMGMSSQQHQQNLDEYAKCVTTSSTGFLSVTTKPDTKQLLKIRQFKLDSIAIQKVMDKEKVSEELYKGIFYKIKP